MVIVLTNSSAPDCNLPSRSALIKDTPTIPNDCAVSLISTRKGVGMILVLVSVSKPSDSFSFLVYRFSAVMGTLLSPSVFIELVYGITKSCKSSVSVFGMTAVESSLESTTKNLGILSLSCTLQYSNTTGKIISDDGSNPLNDAVGLMYVKSPTTCPCSKSG